MRQFLMFARTTILGGIIFLVPLVVLIVVVGKGLQITSVLADALMPVLASQSIEGELVAQLLSVVLLVAVCFLAGLVARMQAARSLVALLDARVLSKLPVYMFIKANLQGFSEDESQEDMTAVIVRLDDSWQIGFEVERIDEEFVAVYFPGAPNPWSGSVAFVERDRVQPLDMPVKDAARLSRYLGRDTGKTLSGKINAPIAQ